MLLNDLEERGRFRVKNGIWQLKDGNEIWRPMMPRTHRRLYQMAFGSAFGGVFKAPMGAGMITNILASVPWVAQWKFNNNGNDSIGTNHLTAINSPTFTTGKLGGATGATQLVRSSTQYWSVADNPVLSMSDIDFSICGWVYFDSTSVFQSIVQKFDGVKYEYVVYFTANRIQFYMDASGAGNVAANTFGAISTGTWYCFVAWHDSVNNVLGIAVNNVSDTAAFSLGTSDRGAALTIGSSDNTLNGRADNIGIAKSVASGGGVLTPSQRTAFYNIGNGTEQLT